MTLKKCFVIAPIGETESDTRKRSDQVLKHIIKPAANECGYDPIRADQISEPGIITSQVIQHIVEDPLVIADLTGRNPNVFYELAIRHALKKALIQIIKNGEPIPFDVAPTRTIHVDHHDLDSVEEAKNEIIKQIKIVEKDVSEIDTPISVALDLQLLRQSENPEQRSLADLVDAISDLRNGLMSIERKINDPGLSSSQRYIEYILNHIRPSSIPSDILFEMRDLSKQILESGLPSESSVEYNKFRDMLKLLIRLLDSHLKRERDVADWKIIRTPIELSSFD